MMFIIITMFMFMYSVFLLCIFRSNFRLYEFRLFNCFSICFVLLKRATLSAHPKFVRFSPSTVIPPEISAFLKTSSITSVKSLCEHGSPCLTPLYIRNSSDTNLSNLILAVDWLYMFRNFFMCFVYVGFSQCLKDGKVPYCVKGFLLINEAYA